jgi:hypothetical protein
MKSGATTKSNIQLLQMLAVKILTTLSFMYSKYMEKNLYKKLFEVLDSEFGDNSVN